MNYKRGGNKAVQIPESWEKLDPKSAQEIKQEGFCSWSEKQHINLRQGIKVNSKTCNVIRILTFPEFYPNGSVEYIKEFAYTHNLVTNDGEIYYAKKGAGETPSTNENFLSGRFEIGTTAYAEAETDTFSNFDVSCTSKISGSRQVFTGGYPKTNDTGDADNTGDSVQAVSYAVLYTAASWNDASVEQGVIHDNASPVGGTKLLNTWSFTSFAKTACDTLKVFVNHTFENQ